MLRSLPLLLAAALLCVGGAVRVAQSGQEEGYALLAAGLVILGGWAALEFHTWRHHDRDEP
jgi:hypothetical protein